MKRILVVDDQSCVRELVKQVLELWEDDIDIAEAEDGIEALHILGTRTYDLMVCDINMPHLDGVELVEKLRKTTYNRDLPIIMLTGNKDESQIAGALRSGATSYLTKPFNVADLIEALEACTDWDMRNQPNNAPRN